MLGIKLTPDDEERLARHALESRRPKSALAREWILERLNRESIDAEVARASAIIAANTTSAEIVERGRDADAWLRQLDTEDGGYDWGPAGSPA